MARVKHEGQWYGLDEGESVLDGLLRRGVEVPHSCRAGACQSCLMRAERGEVPARAQVGLKETLKARGYFLACACQPEGELEVAGAGADLRVPARITSLERLSDSVLCVRLRPEGDFEYRAGQYVSVLRTDGLARSYSLASLPHEDTLALHVRRVPGGRMSGWLFEEARPGDVLELQGPAGECFYVPGRPEQSLLLVGTGTGLAPLYGIIRDALERGHTGPIWLFHGAVDVSGLYLVEELRALQSRHPQLQYRPCVSKGQARVGVTVGALDAIIKEVCPRPAGWRGYLCGSPDLVLSLRKKLFLAGLSLKEIHADAFLPSTPPPQGGAGVMASASDASR
ncbi:2Fe-2S iron-sulfur cluster binding domain-containing protein [Archangium violaceum]|uniref:2Fe-2S iron-sulfur cluster-binding protein n=1 Tax=Archangium violaceum TaxID=83451 RepID=UPI00193AFD2F|nr:2Fe-2S iron-sulfur cluster-binding protein [Archangium violaceum]QRK10203.1 2Fe-2S iron-sulfur cluster binding domain-containing protein [Archangium violaceum]